MAQHHIFGKQGEEMACEYLLKNGFAILEKNWRHLKAEVDIIATIDKMLVIVEVKTRATADFGAPEESINSNKQRLLCEAANAYLELNQLKNEIRFDIISIISKNNHTELNHIVDAFSPFANEQE
jgi:putative endonuclease